MYSKIFILVGAILCFSDFSSSAKLNWSDCGSETGSLIDVVVKDCDTERCPLKRNHNATLSITFKSNVVCKAVTAVVFGEVLGFKSKFNLPNPTSCDANVGLQCPLEADRTYTYTNTIFVKPKYPKVTVDIDWELHDDDEKKIFCAVIPAQIVEE